MVEKKNITATCSEICEYIDKEVSPGDKVGLSLGRCYVPGKVVTNNDGVLQIEVNSDMIKGLSCLDIQELKEFLVELEHECESGVCVIEAKDD
ncbi:MAG: DUF2097 domain-containing protein [Methanobrevibacter sp.]|nr:DUF2097 domain-containing protein [Methanobrevibacter sp.]